MSLAKCIKRINWLKCGIRKRFVEKAFREFFLTFPHFGWRPELDQYFGRNTYQLGNLSFPRANNKKNKFPTCEQQEQSYIFF